MKDEWLASHYTDLYTDLIIMHHFHDYFLLSGKVFCIYILLKNLKNLISFTEGWLRPKIKPLGISQ